MFVKKIGLATVLKAWNFLKRETSTQVFPCEYSKSFRDTAFFIQQFWWLLLK